MSSAFKNKLIISFAVLLVTSFCLYFFLPGSEYFIAGLAVIYFSISIHYLQLKNSSKYSEYIEKNRGYLRLVEIIFIGILYFLWPSDYDQMMSAALKIRDAHPEQKIFDGEVEPPMPNKAENNKTMTGIDINKNGIRDDVDIWINRKSQNFNELRLFRQHSRAMTESFKECEEKNGIISAEKVFSKIVAVKFCASALNLNLNAFQALYINNVRREKCLSYFKIVGAASDYNLNLKNPEGPLQNCNFQIEKR